MTAPDVTSIELSTSDEQRLIELEQVIESGMDTFIAVGSAIAEIRDSRLYRATHDSLEAYLIDRWEISRSRGYQLIEAARVSTIVDTAGINGPRTESQTRPLSGLNDEQVLTVWTDAVEQSAGKPTAADVVESRKRLLPAQGAGPAPATSRRRPLPDAFKSALYDTAKRAESLAKLARDERWDKHADALRRGPRSDLGRLIDSLQRVYDALGTIDQELPDDGERGDKTSFSTSTRSVVIDATHDNTARVQASTYLRASIRTELEHLGVRCQTDRTTKDILFPTRHADDLAAALEIRRINVTIQRGAR